MNSRPNTWSAYDLPEHGAPRRWWPRLRNTRIRDKLALILAVPLVAVLALAAVRLATVGRGAQEAGMVHSLTALSTEVSALFQDVHKERMAAAVYLADRTAKPDTYSLQARLTDERVAAYQARRAKLRDVPPAVTKRLRAIDVHLSALSGTRQKVLDRQPMPIAEAVLRYGVVLTDLVSYADALGQVAGTGDVADGLRALAAFSRAKAALAEEEGVVFSALSGGRLGQEQFAAFVATLTSQQDALLVFLRTASPEQRELVESTVTGEAVELVDRIAAELTRSVGRAPQVTAGAAVQAIGAVNELMRWAETQLESRLLDEAEKVFADVLWQATLESVLVLLSLGLAIALTVVLIRSLSHSLRRLRDGALLVADHDLPEAVNRLRDVDNLGEGGVDEIVRQVRDPIRLANEDEVGQVARAFNVVHREAVRIAAEQAALRANVSAMFLNLARRSQALVDRMIGELDLIERNEEDPKRLARLFELDHLATRMRRNDENLLVLAGADTAVPRREDALLVDALRAAQSEVELYHRVEFGTVDSDILIAAHAVNDVVRLVAELLDNATRFSPPETAVIAEARRTRDFVLIQVEDRGLGLADEQMTALNFRLSRPSEVDVAAFRLMGLAVVSRLAARYGIRVELRRNIDGGTIAQVTLPSSTVILPGVPAREQSIPGARQPLAVESALTSARSGVTIPAQAGAVAAVATDPRAPALGAPVAAGSPALPRRVPGGTTSNPATVGITGPGPTLPSGPVAGAAAVRADAGEDMPIFRETETTWFRAYGQEPATTFPAPAGDQPVGRTARYANVPQPPVPPARAQSTGGFPPPATASGPYPSRPAAGNPSPASTPPYSPGATSGPASYSAPQRSGPASYAAPQRPEPASHAAPQRPEPASHAAPQRPEPASHAAPAAPTESAGAGPGMGGIWRTAADEGWARAGRAAQPASGGTTRSGLPKRVPQAQLVPGGVETRGDRDHTRRSPDEVRGLLSAYHRGVQRGRSAGSAHDGTTSIKETSG